MAANTSELISNVVNSKCPLSIWDPCPQALTWHGPPDYCGGNPGTLTSRSRLVAATTPLAKNPLFPKFIPPNDDSGNCDNWEPLTSAAWNNNEMRERSRAIVPQYSTDRTLFRFCIILAGPPGSGKSTMVETLRDRAQIINMKASRKPWITLGHDQIICQDPVFQNALNAAPFPNADETEQTILNDLQISGSKWEKEMKRQNIAYRKARGNIRDKEVLRANIIEYIPQLDDDYGQKIELYLCPEIPCISNDIDLKIIIEEWCRNKFIAKGQLPPFGNKDTGVINNTELLYIKTALCIKKGFNIAYETTLKDTQSIEYLFQLSQVLTKGCTKYNYIFLMGFPIVSFNCLEERIVKRYQNWAKQTREERAKSFSQCMTVGLPNLSRIEFIAKMNNAYMTIASLIWFCTGNIKPVVGPPSDPGREQCPPGLGIDFLLIFDNTGCIKEKEYIMLPISKRSYKIGIGKLFKRQVGIQTKTKRAIIAILMRSLNCLKGIPLCKGRCTGASCNEKKKEEEEEQKKEVKSESNCWSLPPSQDVDFDDDDDDASQRSTLYNMEQEITEFMDDSSLLSWSLGRQEVIDLRRQLEKEYPNNIADIQEVMDNPQALRALKLLFENIPQIRKTGIPFHTSATSQRLLMNPFDQLITVYSPTQIYNYLKCIIAAGGINVISEADDTTGASACSYNHLEYREAITGTVRHFPADAVICLEQKNCGLEGGSKKKSRKKRYKKRKRRTRRMY